MLKLNQKSGSVTCGKYQLLILIVAEFPFKSQQFLSVFRNQKRSVFSCQSPILRELGLAYYFFQEIFKKINYNPLLSGFLARSPANALVDASRSL